MAGRGRDGPSGPPRARRARRYSPPQARAVAVARGRGRRPPPRPPPAEPFRPPCPSGPGEAGRGGGTGPPAPGAAVNRGGLRPVRPSRAAPPRREGPRTNGRQGSAATSVSHPTRLETRTKESDARASRRASRTKPCGAMKVRAGAPRLRWDPAAGDGRRAHHRPVSPAPPGRWSMSARGRTRKMVNYAWAGRSQRKLWWRSAAVLTCKSVVRPGYRGERLIEPSSSWFPPKFPSG